MPATSELGPGSGKSTLHGTMSLRITARPAGLNSLFSHAQAWLGDRRTPPPTAIGAKEDRWAALSPLYKQLPPFPRYSDGVPCTRQTRSVQPQREG